MVRSAGCYAQLVGKDAGYAQLKLSSGELRVVREECLATVGAVSNPDNQNKSLGKAGRNRWLGNRPVSRGVAMNPVDHPWVVVKVAHPAVVIRLLRGANLPRVIKLVLIRRRINSL